MNLGEGRAISSRRQAWLEARCIDLDLVEATSMEDDSVEDCAVVTRETKSGETTLVAYIVASGSFSSEGLREHLRAMLPEAMLPSACVPVSALPLTPSGEIDFFVASDPKPRYCPAMRTAH